jgi:glucosyl-3-phosphoglycerate phosphatase
MLTRPVDILLLRHGQSEWNAVGRWQGMADSPLTELGREQASLTGRLLARADVRFSGLWSSDLSRAAETAAIIGAQLRLPPPVTDQRLREAHAGEWEGMTADEIDVEWPGYLEAHRRPPSFETFETVARRAIASLRTVADSRPAWRGVPLVVAHSGLIRTVMRRLGAIDERVPNLGGTWLTVDAGLPTGDALENDGIALGDLFDPDGIVISGIDSHGEDPGDQADHANDHGTAKR